jgi:signal transduction histidine kinase
MARVKDDFREHNLLIVDDELEIQKALRRQFRRLCKVHIASSGAEALQILREQSIHAIISDQRMPEMTGSEFLNEVKGEYPDAIRLLLTGYADINAVIDAINQGQIYRYITKPWDPTELETIVREAFQRYDLIVENRQLLDKLRQYNEELEEMVAERTSELKEANEHLVVLHQQKDWFVGMVAHDLRSPLATLITVLSVVTEDSGMSDEEKQELLNMVRGNIDGMLSLINDLLDLNAIQSGEVTLERGDFSAPRLLEEVVWGCTQQAEDKDIPLTLNVAPDLPALYGDTNRIRQVLVNLVTNAIKFSHRGKPVQLSASLDGDKILFSVEDQGQGIKEGELGKLFKDFQRTSTRPTEGESSNGLGLSICKRLVEIHGGEIGVESVHGEGSRFFFTLPHVDLRPNKIQTDEAQTDEAQTGD